jgi:transposase
MGCGGGGRLWSKAGQQELQKIPLREGMGRRREDLRRLVRQLSVWIKELDQQIEEEVARREDAQRLMTHPGVGPQTALARKLAIRLYLMLRDGIDDEEFCRRAPRGWGEVRMPGCSGM